MVHRPNKKIAGKIAKERINMLLELAQRRMTEGEEELAKRYVDLALLISKKYNVRIPRNLKYRICKKCHSFLIPGKNARVRLKRGKVVITCLKCGCTKRYKYK